MFNERKRKKKKNCVSGDKFPQNIRENEAASPLETLAM